MNACPLLRSLQPIRPQASLLGALIALLILAACSDPNLDHPSPNAAGPASADATKPDRRLVLTFDDLPFQGPSATFRGEDRFHLASLQSMNEDLVQALLATKAPILGLVNEGKLRGADGEPSVARAALLEIWLGAGFELGNHTYSHNSLNTTPIEEFQDDVLRGEKTLRRLAQKYGHSPPRYFRHPFLHTGRTQEIKRDFAQFLAANSYRVAPVTIDNAEWIFAKAYALALLKETLQEGTEQANLVKYEYLDYMMKKTAFSERQSRELLGREIPQILLLHDNRLNADAIVDLAQLYQERGYRFITLEDALKDPAFQRPDGYEGPAGISWIERWAFADGVDKSFFAGGPTTKQWILDLAEIESE